MTIDGPKASDCRAPEVLVTDIKLRFVENGRDGLIAWASCVLNHTMVLNNIAVRRGRDNGLRLTYPAKRTTIGTRFYYFNPISTEAAQAIQNAVLARLAALAMASAAAAEEGGRGS